ncbi:hypothetical protein CVT24_008216 [Panaeolus cyanescens]|uniref:Mitochondrial K+-H+ exchange-related-domain-containing protein n=1 Tax=Panaeolus cyanescens TaxID=181874 RepID=A0A409VF26_9AGAR|nr:hypothetical protein CVT24_008216 [Panaeolus cyanescens]
MSTTSALRGMRIISIPLTKPTGSGFGHHHSPATALKPTRLTYYQFQTPPKKAKERVSTDDAHEKGVDKAVDASGKGKGRSWWPEHGIGPWMTKKAADTWAGFGKAKGGWKLKLYETGEKMVDRMDFEELALKGLDPSLGPSITHLKRVKEIEDKRDVPAIPLIFPASQISPSQALKELSAYAQYRIPKHKRGFIMWLAISPITAPFMIIPVIPNIPFFFCIWRSWSHYKAYKSSLYLKSLVDHDVLVPEASESLDAIYAKYSPASPESIAAPESSESPSASSESSPLLNSKGHVTLLTRDAVEPIMSAFEVDPDSTASADLHRAIEQARVRVKDGLVDA